MPFPFALVPVPVHPGAAVAARAPRPDRESRLFQSSALACALALAFYALLAAALPLIAPAIAPRAVEIIYTDPHAPLPVPQVDPPTRAAGPRATPPEAPPELLRPEPDVGIVIPVPEEVPLVREAARAEPGPGPTDDAEVHRSPGGAGTGTGEPDGGQVLDYWEEAPQVLRDFTPEYPGLARDAGVSGTVVLHVLVGRDGRVEAVRVLESIPLLDEAAIDAARRWLFLPARVSGRPVRVWVALPVRFKLH